ncbi:MAG: 50S ribosomal protein L4 [Patescibacteria group bacterium]
MLKINVYNLDGTVAQELDLPSEVFGVNVDRSLLHRVLVSRASGRRAGTAHTKTRDEVRGGGKKPWRQKGTGRARHGSTRSPLWKGGGVVFGPRNEQNWERKVNVKVARKALAMAFSAQHKSKHMVMMKEFILKEPKTKVFLAALREMRAHIDELSHLHVPTPRQELLIVFPKLSQETFTRASRNVPGVRAVSAHDVAIEDVVGYRTIIMIPEVIPILLRRCMSSKNKNGI